MPSIASNVICLFPLGQYQLAMIMSVLLNNNFPLSTFRDDGMKTLTDASRLAADLPLTADRSRISTSGSSK